jgi:phytoene desaturase
MSKKVVIIGAGFGGLALGIRLKVIGFEVTILEKQAHPGGQAQPLYQGGYRFDMGPSLLTAPELIEELFALAGRDRRAYLTWERLDPFYRVYFWDGSYLDYTDDSERMKAQLARFDERDARAYDAFMARSKAFYQAVIEEGLGRRPFTLRELVQFLPKALRLEALRSSYSLAAKFFRDERSRFIFSFHPLFIGGDPFRAPAVYQMIPYLEKAGGVWYVRGGMHGLAQGLARLFTDIGGRLLLKTEAQRILTHLGKVIGVRTSQGDLPADLVVSNADFFHTYFRLIGQEALPSIARWRLRQYQYGMSAFLIYAGLNRTYPDTLPHHTIVLGPRYRGLVEDIFRRKVLPSDFSLYLHAPTRTDESWAPPNGESLYILSPVANLQSGISWQETAPAYQEKILTSLQERLLPGLQNTIQTLSLYTPEDFLRDRHCTWGSPWGIEPRLIQTANLRPPNRSYWIKGLYLVGTNTHPGAGVPGVILSAAATAEAILNDLGLPLPKPAPVLTYE